MKPSFTSVKAAFLRGDFEAVHAAIDRWELARAKAALCGNPSSFPDWFTALLRVVGKKIEYWAPEGVHDLACYQLAARYAALVPPGDGLSLWDRDSGLRLISLVLRRAAYHGDLATLTYFADVRFRKCRQDWPVGMVLPWIAEVMPRGHFSVIEFLILEANRVQGGSGRAQPNPDRQWMIEGFVLAASLRHGGIQPFFSRLKRRLAGTCPAAGARRAYVAQCLGEAPYPVAALQTILAYGSFSAVPKTAARAYALLWAQACGAQDRAALELLAHEMDALARCRAMRASANQGWLLPLQILAPFTPPADFDDTTNLVIAALATRNRPEAARWLVAHGYGPLADAARAYVAKKFADCDRRAAQAAALPETSP